MTKINVEKESGISGFYQQTSINSLKEQQDKLYKTLSTLLGSKLAITLNDGKEYTGVYGAVNPVDLSVQVLQARDNKGEIIPDLVCNGDNIVAMKFNYKPVALSGFHTDTAISRAGPIKERVFEKWNPSDDVPLDMNLDESAGPWDQFSVNEKKFGVKTDFDPDMYTTILDKSAPDFRKKEAEANRLAREIERGLTTNAHILEERGHKAHDNNMNEEDRPVRKPEPNNRPISFAGTLNYKEITTLKATEKKPIIGKVVPLIKPSDLSKEKVGPPVNYQGRGQKISTPIESPGGRIDILQQISKSPKVATLPTQLPENYTNLEITNEFKNFHTTEKNKRQNSRKADLEKFKSFSVEIEQKIPKTSIKVADKAATSTSPVNATSPALTAADKATNAKLVNKPQETIPNQPSQPTKLKEKAVENIAPTQLPSKLVPKTTTAGPVATPSKTKPKTGSVPDTGSNSSGVSSSAKIIPDQAKKTVDTTQKEPSEPNDSHSQTAVSDSTTTSAKPKKDFKLSVTAAEFTPASSQAYMKRPKDGYKKMQYNKGHNQYYGYDPHGYPYPPPMDPSMAYYPPPYNPQYPNGNAGYRPMQPNGYPVMMPMQPGPYQYNSYQQPGMYPMMPQQPMYPPQGGMMPFNPPHHPQAWYPEGQQPPMPEDGTGELEAGHTQGLHQDGQYQDEGYEQSPELQNE
ncbi:hypothetical protein HDV02_000268 [Globomyces sp. JEL0801]|nr:hypothetical protein HDV02_000268 [Globomyces sp. JEL0801]